MTAVTRGYVLQTALRQVTARSDVLLGPYSTQLMRTAGRVAAETNRLLWNHGGSGDDVEAAHPGCIVSVLTLASRYAQPFLGHLAGDGESCMLWIAHGKGSSGRQVAAGACAPRNACAVAAGVHDFGRAIGDLDGVYGIAQWIPRTGYTAELGPSEADFLAAYADATAEPPDYPAVQAAAGAVLAAHCARHAGGTTRELLWPVACGLDTETLFGGFKIDPASGAQVRHETVLVRWTSAGLT